MAQRTTPLISVLTAREQAMREMLRLLDEERAAIIAFDTERLQQAVERKVRLAAEMEELDGTCRELLAREGAQRGIAGVVTLSPLIPKTPASEQGELRNLKAQLTALATEVRRMIDHNRALLESSLSAVGRSLTFFQNRFKVAETYGHSGHMVERTANVTMLRREL